MPNKDFVKGKEKEGGRTKGTPNKFTNLKQAFLDVFEQIEKEGDDRESKIRTLFKFATRNDRNQAIFYQMISKMLPANIDVDLTGNLNTDKPILVNIVKTHIEEQAKEKDGTTDSDKS